MTEEVTTERSKVVIFKTDWLVRVGYNVPNAIRIAEDESLDWHLALKLLRECPDEKLCMRVLFGE